MGTQTCHHCCGPGAQRGQGGVGRGGRERGQANGQGAPTAGRLMPRCRQGPPAGCERGLAGRARGPCWPALGAGGGRLRVDEAHGTGTCRRLWATNPGRRPPPRRPPTRREAPGSPALLPRAALGCPAFRCSSAPSWLASSRRPWPWPVMPPSSWRAWSFPWPLWRADVGIWSSGGCSGARRRAIEADEASRGGVKSGKTVRRLGLVWPPPRPAARRGQPRCAPLAATRAPPPRSGVLRSGRSPRAPPRSRARAPSRSVRPAWAARGERRP